MISLPMEVTTRLSDGDEAWETSASGLLAGDNKNVAASEIAKKEESFKCVP